MKHIIIITMAMFFSTAIMAQQIGANISFATLEHNFETVIENNGKVKCVFVFTNTGNKTLVVQHVSASCGCTTPKWTNAPLKTGASGEISVEFNPKNRLGTFNKTIKVTSNGSVQPIVLRIKGNVVAGEKTLQEEYRIKMGKIRAKTNNISFAKILNTETRTETVDIVNDSEEDIKISFDRVPAHLKVKAVPSKLKPKQGGKIEVEYIAKKRNDWDYVRDNLFVVLNGEKHHKNRFTVSATIKEDFGDLSKSDMQNSPKAEFENQTFAFGEINQGDVVKHQFVLKNSGKEDLIIRKTRASCGCTATKPEKSVIKPGESTNLEVVFNSTHKKGKQNKNVTVITNDPRNERIVLWIKGNVKPKQ